MTNDDTTWLVNEMTGKHIGPFTTRIDALLALNIAAGRLNWVAMSRTDFDAHLKRKSA